MAGGKNRGLALQKEYSRKRQRALNQRDEEKILKVIERIVDFALRRNIDLDTLRQGDKVGWEVIYGKVNSKLMDAELTINLEAESWFGTNNQFQTYATTYQRSITDIGGGKQAMPSSYKKDGVTRVEPANERLWADDKVTLPASWSKKSILHPQRARLYKAMSATDGVDKKKLTKTNVGTKEAFEIVNPSFNLHSKQVFAALNYGNRLHGSSTQYGYSYISLKPVLKQNAIYFPEDTFLVASATNGKAATDKQCTYNTLGAVLAYCHPDMATEIFTSCYDGLVCGESMKASLLLEAHIFEEVVMNRHVEELVLSRRTEAGDLSAPVWATVKANAADWARRNNTRVVRLSA